MSKSKVINWMTQNNANVRVGYHSKAKKVLLCDGPALAFPIGWHLEHNSLTNGILKIPMIKNPFNR